MGIFRNNKRKMGVLPNPDVELQLVAVRGAPANGTDLIRGGNWREPYPQTFIELPSSHLNLQQTEAIIKELESRGVFPRLHQPGTAREAIRIEGEKVESVKEIIRQLRQGNCNAAPACNLDC